MGPIAKYKIWTDLLKKGILLDEKGLTVMLEGSGGRPGTTKISHHFPFTIPQAQISFLRNEPKHLNGVDNEDMEKEWEHFLDQCPCLSQAFFSVNKNRPVLLRNGWSRCYPSGINTTGLTRLLNPPIGLVTRTILIVLIEIMTANRHVVAGIQTAGVRHVTVIGIIRAVFIISLLPPF